ncbi:hypothetical protein EDD11_008121 [Mortierella claussenii]|nr:hypothetical protein EDD11_008121 [Mortierella claussenii]
MSVAVPAYTNVCIAPDRSGLAVWLIGVSTANEGRLEAYSVNLANINSPTATLIANQTDLFSWSSQAQRACFSYPGNAASLNSPIVMQQFGPKSYFTNVYPNGTIDLATNFIGVGFVSPKTFSLTGAVGGLDWFTAVANVTNLQTNSPWTGVRLNGTLAVSSVRDFLISQYPTPNPLLSVGTYVSTSNTPAQGYHIVFDNIGGGVVYTTLDSSAPITIDQQDRILSLSNPQNVDMGGIKLTASAVPITMAGVGYILDQALDGSTVLYSINPSQSAKLQRVSVQGNVPPFSPSIAATALNAQIVIYGASSSSVTTSTFNAFDTVAGTWSGPGLVKAYIPPATPSGSPSATPTSGNSSSGSNDSNKAPLGAIIGGVVGGLVLIALIAFLFIRHRRKPTKATTVEATSAAAAGAGAGAALDHHGKNDNYLSGAPPMHQNYGLVQQNQQQVQFQPHQQQQQSYNPHHSFIPQMYGVNPTKDSYTVPQQQQSPMIFQQQQQQQQQPYSYTPPTLTAVPQQQHPNIFQPQSDAGSNPSYSQAIYTASVTTPQTPYTPVSQVYTSSTSTPSSPQYSRPPEHQGYIS